MRRCIITLCGLLALALAGSPATGQGKLKKPISEVELSQLMSNWEKEVKARIGNSERLKSLANKNSLAILHCFRMNAAIRHPRSTFSFAHDSALFAVNGGVVHISYYGDPPQPYVILEGEKSLLVRLKASDFEKAPDPKKINIADPGIATDRADVADGDTFLMRVRDCVGNDFYVIFQILFVEREGRFISFLWRVVPGGRPIVRFRPVVPEN